MNSQMGQPCPSWSRGARERMIEHASDELFNQLDQPRPDLLPQLGVLA